MKIPLKPWFTHLSNLNLTVVMILKMPLSMGYLSMNWFQLVLSTAARVVTCTRKCDQITPVLIRLHWLIVIFFKTLGPPPLEFFGFNFLLLDRLPKALVQLFFVLLDLPVSTVTLNKWRHDRWRHHNRTRNFYVDVSLRKKWLFAKKVTKY